MLNNNEESMSEDQAPESAPEVADEAQEAESKRVAELSREAASYRSQRNQALRRASAYLTMLKAHSVDVSMVTEESLSNLPIHEGKVDGEFKYKAPSINVPKARQNQRADTGTRSMTLGDIKSMSMSQINAQWGDVKRVLQQGRQQA